MKKKDLEKFNKAIRDIQEYKKNRSELAEAVCGYIMVANEDFLFKVAEMIASEEKK